MTDSLLLDTHIALWLESGDERLQPGTRALIEACWHGGGTIVLSAVTAWESRDSADRLPIATAIDLACPLVTYDGRILHFAEAHGRQYRLAVAS